MVTSGSKSVKNCQKVLKKPHFGLIPSFSKKKFALANLIRINNNNLRKKSVTSLDKFRTYFFPLGEVEPSFSNLLTRANDTRPCFFWLTFIKVYLVFRSLRC